MTAQFQFATSDLPEHERAGAWKNFIVNNTFDGHFETVGRMPVDGKVVAKPVGPAMCAEVSSTPIYLEHRREHIEPAGSQRFIVQAVIEGNATYIGRTGGRLDVGPGGLFFGESGFPCGFLAEENTRIASFMLPRSAIMPRYATTEAVLARKTFQDFPSRLLFDLVAELPRGTLGYARQSTVANAVGALVALALDGALGERLGEESARASRLYAIRDYLRAHYADAALTPATVAERFRISVRHLHRLMEETGRSFREELLAVRLAAAHRALTTEAQRNQTIAEVAYGNGFNDLSQFNRRFRATFDMTPREARRCAQ
ncbi:MAG TPA: helix-turn-helix domain-containing protein [Rhizomicrobium sp.]|jgi:AraC-like DNA-binding protein|nr:helix-turn-helix domain-containing protein [Rhizomicrobium sp.]